MNVSATFFSEVISKASPLYQASDVRGSFQFRVSKKIWNSSVLLVQKWLEQSLHLLGKMGSPSWRR